MITTPHAPRTMRWIGLSLLFGASVVVAGMPSPVAASEDRQLVPPSYDGPAARISGAVATGEASAKFQKNVSSICPGSQPYCVVPLGRLGRTQRLEVSSVSCVLGAAGGPRYLMLRTSDSFDFFAPQPTQYGFALVNSETQFTIKPRETFSLIYEASDVVNRVSCKVAGDLYTAN